MPQHQEGGRWTSNTIQPTRWYVADIATDWGDIIYDT